jgi:hypothetical protein
MLDRGLGRRPLHLLCRHAAHSLLARNQEYLN